MSLCGSGCESGPPCMGCKGSKVRILSHRPTKRPRASGFIDRTPFFIGEGRIVSEGIRWDPVTASANRAYKRGACCLSFLGRLPPIRVYLPLADARMQQRIARSSDSPKVVNLHELYNSNHSKSRMCTRLIAAMDFHLVSLQIFSWQLAITGVWACL